MLRELPNIISIGRIILVGPIVFCLIEDNFTYAAVLFAVAGISDGLDGFLAKRFGWISHLGSILDPLADKLLLVSCYVVLGWKGFLPPWLVAAVIIRDVVIVVGALLYHFKIETVKGLPLGISKVNTLVQIVLVIAVIVHHGFFALPGAAVDTLIYLVLLTTVWSGMSYVWIWGRRALKVSRGRAGD